MTNASLLSDWAFLSFTELKRRNQEGLVTEGWSASERAGVGSPWDYPGRAAQVVVASETLPVPEHIAAQGNAVLAVFLDAMGTGLGGILPGDVGSVFPGPPGRLAQLATSLDAATGGVPVSDWLKGAESVLATLQDAAAPPTAPPAEPAAPPSAPASPDAPSPPPTAPPSPPPARPPWALSEARRLVQRRDPFLHEVASRIPGATEGVAPRAAVERLCAAPWFVGAVADYLVAVRTVRAQRIAGGGGP